MASKIPRSIAWSRKRLLETLDEMFAAKVSLTNLDAVEGKLFGIGVESYTVGSHEFYMGYAIQSRSF